MYTEVKAHGMEANIMPIYDPRWRIVWAEKGSKEVKGSVPFEQTDEFCAEMKIPKFKPQARYPILHEHTELIEKTVGPGINVDLNAYNYWIDCTTGEPKFVIRVYMPDFPEGYMDFDIQKHDLKIMVDDELAAFYIASGKSVTGKSEASYIGYTSEEIAREKAAKEKAKAALAKAKASRK
jgi:hypothetical protein